MRIPVEFVSAEVGLDAEAEPDCVADDVTERRVAPVRGEARREPSGL